MTPIGPAWVSLWTARRDMPGYANRHQRKRRGVLWMICRQATEDALRSKRRG